MNALQQHVIDSYRAARHGEPPPAPPGRHDRAVLRAVRTTTAATAAAPGPHGPTDVSPTNGAEPPPGS
ncbi:hypothetical protein OG369_15585 [Streptomyces sp. NBC_01221]|uniref:hypothetical protein n=1 Tax=unclassified Streptomyces TaxID=2593676 RepID=UPI0022510686|nr:MULTISPECIES: hypothetical protein [unclassified Streptomyces]MCX4787556.1 hypothetical protein [Streptomyces sp. NBC_01221]MCX4796659.1 hypothetical protein [Streptomyces sp. NBC_01242]WSJ37888.1 hypothetical protein OG772_19020 [Streptomyces sp. NBC_01321]